MMSGLGFATDAFDVASILHPARSLDDRLLCLVYPTATSLHAPNIRLTADGEPELMPVSWGLVLPQPGKAPMLVTNTRDAEVIKSNFWNESFRKRPPDSCAVVPRALDH